MGVDRLSDILGPVLVFIGNLPYEEIQWLLALPTTLYDLPRTLATTAVGLLVGDSLLGRLIQNFVGALVSYLQGLIIRLTCQLGVPTATVCAVLEQLTFAASQISAIIDVIKLLFVEEDPSRPPPPQPSPPPFPPSFRLADLAFIL